MTIQQLNDQFEKYESLWGEREMVKRFQELTRTSPLCAERDSYPAHLTASAVVVPPDFSKVLLTHHRKLQKWLQLGGHVDGSFDVAAAALREVQEESGLQKVQIYSWRPGEDFPILDLDAHWIPEGKEPGHWHYDIRYVVVAEEPEKIVVSEESLDLKWFPLQEAFLVSKDTSLSRLIRKLDGLARGVLQ